MRSVFTQGSSAGLWETEDEAAFLAESASGSIIGN